MKRRIKLAAIFFSLILCNASCEKDDENDVGTGTSTDTIVTATNFSITIDENPVNGLLLGELQSSTSVSGVSVVYELIEEGDHEAFALSGDFNKNLSVADSSFFDYETSQTVSVLFETILYEGASRTSTSKAAPQVIARDTATITITLNDLDDSPRVIIDDITASIEEGAVSGDFIADIAYRFENTDPTNNITFSIIDTSVSNAVISGLKNGVIGTNEYTLVVSTNAAAFDYETNQTITGKVVISAGDNGVMKDTADFTINVLKKSLSSMLAAREYQEALDDARFTITQVYDTLFNSGTSTDSLLGLDYGGGIIYRLVVGHNSYEDQVRILNYDENRTTTYTEANNKLAAFKTQMSDDSWLIPTSSYFSSQAGYFTDFLPLNTYFYTSYHYFSNAFNRYLYHTYRFTGTLSGNSYEELATSSNTYPLIFAKVEDFDRD